MKLCIIGNPNSMHSYRWVKWFRGQGHQVSFIADVSPVGHWGEIVDFVLPGRFTLPLIKYLFWGIKTRQLIKHLSPEILQAHRVSSAGWLGGFANFHPFVIIPWGSDLLVHPYRSRLARLMANYSLKRADLVIANSDGLRNSSIHFGAHPNNVVNVKWTAVDREIFHPNIDVTSLKFTLDLREEPVVLSPRAVGPIYNIDLVIKAIPAVREAIPEVKFVFLEFNVKKDYKAYLLRLIKEFNIEANIRWIGPLEKNEQMAQLFNIAQVVVSVSSSDSMPPSVLEAMACGVPVISTDIPSMREWITDGENGLLVPLRDSTALANALIALLKNPEFAISFREKNLELIREHADYHTEMFNIEQLYYNLI